MAGLEFVYQTDDPGTMRRKVGWDVKATYKNGPISKEVNARALECDILIEMMRELDLMEARANVGKTTVYVSERWLKPLVVKGIRLPAILRILSPRYFNMVRRFIRLMDNERFFVFPCGVHAVRDFVRLYHLIHGDLRYLFRSPNVDIERHLGGSVAGFPRMKLWGYFVEPSKISHKPREPLAGRMLKILWCGHMTDWKCVDILVKAFCSVCKKRHVALQLVGEGRERARLVELSSGRCHEKIGWEDGVISICGYLTNEVVRKLMNEADLYVMPSNAEEGWGAAVSDALTEGCPVISTFEAGSSATLLPERFLYHAKNYSELVAKLLDFNGATVEYDVAEWGGANAAKRLLEIVK